MASLQLFLLGPYQALSLGQPVTDLAYDKVRALLAYLAVESDRPHRREALAGLLWPDQDESAARHSLSQALWTLRRSIGDHDAEPAYLHIRRDTVQFNPASNYTLDVAEFLGFLRRRDRHEYGEGTNPPVPIRVAQDRLSPYDVRQLEQAVDLYRGSFLEQFSIPDSVAFEEWATVTREYLHQRACDTLAQLSDYYERRGEMTRACEYARRQITFDPWREDIHRSLMRMLAASGQPAAALKQYQRCRQLLSDELGVEPEEETTSLYQRIRDARDAQGIPRIVSSSSSRARSYLPSQSTPFVGRESELVKLSELLSGQACRLITLVGPGGIGKTRLAIQAAASEVGTFADGVRFVPLAGLGSASLLANAISDVLSVSLQGQEDPTDQLLAWMAEREMLLVLDNFEHLLDGTMLVAELVDRAPDLHVLVTSRERLNLRGEWVFEVEGLSVPEAEGDGFEEAGAVQLFLQSARKSYSGFRLEAEDREHITRICRQVGGMPLGIELAAAWAPALSCEEIAQEIETSLDFLSALARDAPERHRSMRAVFDRSWNLLTEYEQRAFRRLSIFRGGFRRAAAEYVAGASLPALSALVSKSLLRRNAAGRYEIHELLRQYAEDKLEEIPDEAEAVGHRHCSYYTDFLALREQPLKGENQSTVLEEIDAEIENIRAAWRWGIERVRADAIAKATHALWLFYETTGRYQEGQAAFRDAAVAIERTASVDDGTGREQALALGRTLTSYGSYFIRVGDLEQGNAVIDRGIDLLRRLDAPVDLGLAYNFRAMYAHAREDYEQARQDLLKSVARFEEANDRWGMAYSLTDLGMATFLTGEYGEAQQLHQQSLDIFTRIGDKRGMSFALNNLGVIACRLGNYAEARRLLTESLAIRRSIRHGWGTADSLHQLGVVARATGAYDESRACFLDALQVAIDIQSFPVALEILVDLAVVLLLQGQRERALDILAVVLEHPVSSPAVHDRAGQLMTEFDIEGIPAATASLFDRPIRTLDDLVQSLLHEGRVASFT